MNLFIYTSTYRQQEEEFVAILDRIRRGNCFDLPYLNNKFCNPVVNGVVDATDSNVLPTKIFTHKKDVDMMNNLELNKLAGIQCKTYKIDSVSFTIKL